jgi:hypothetical protein
LVCCRFAHGHIDFAVGLLARVGHSVEEISMHLSRRAFLRAGCTLGGVALSSLGGRLGPGEALATPFGGHVDPGELPGKVLCGYQGWFRCPGDRAGVGWRHWSRNANQIAPNTLTFDMWPDMSEYHAREQYPAPGFTYPDGSQAYLFSSIDPHTVNRHFRWMHRYGIDGVLVQRFVTGVANPPSASQVLANARAAANATGRVFAVEYDMSGMPTDRLFDQMVNDWRWLVDEMGITTDPRYLHQNGLPVLGIWGFFTDRFDASVAHQIIDFFTSDPDYRVFLVGGCQWWWRSATDPEWARAFRRFDAISPWNVGNVTVHDGVKWASTGSWAGDYAEATANGMLFLPVVYPGFSWDNLMQLPPGTSLIPRLHGAFLWDQFNQVANLGNGMAKVAMFDEVDEGTAIFKVTNSPPTQGYFVTYEGDPSDWYLYLTGQGTQLVRGSV